MYFDHMYIFGPETLFSIKSELIFCLWPISQGKPS